MPIYEFECLDCGHTTEILMARTETSLVVCGACGSKNLKKLLSAHAVVSSTRGLPECASDGCCSAQGPSAACSGPGSCCGKN